MAMQVTKLQWSIAVEQRVSKLQPFSPAAFLFEHVPSQLAPKARKGLESEVLWSQLLDGAIFVEQHKAMNRGKRRRFLLLHWRSSVTTVSYWIMQANGYAA